MAAREALSQTIGRAGTYVRQPQGYRAFIPKRLPRDPPLDVDAGLLDVLSGRRPVS